MELVRKQWFIEDSEQFYQYLYSFSNYTKQDWARNILNTSLEVLVVPTKEMKRIANEIFQGNYTSFLDLKLFRNYESIAIYGMIISRMIDFYEIKKYLSIYKEVIENWAHCDLLSLNINQSNVDEFIGLSNEYMKSEKQFIRRLGLLILLTLIFKDDSYLDHTLNTLLSLQEEHEYYVLMMAGWLLSECIIKYKQRTLLFISNNDMNFQILNKGIQKCRESRRLSQEEKDELIKYKKSRDKKTIYDKTVI